MGKEIACILATAFMLTTICVVATAVMTDGYAMDTTIDPAYVGYCEEIGARYNIAPELLEAIIERESGGQPDVGNTAGCYGLMGISAKWQADRMKKLGVTDLYDPYSNILVGTDFLRELFEKYEDPALVLDYYGGWEGSHRGEAYINGILERSRQLEILHQKIKAKG